LCRVEQQIEQRGTEQFGIRHDRGVRSLHVDVNSGRCRIASHQGNRLGDNRLQTQFNRAGRTRSGEHHQVIDQLAQRVDARDDIGHDWHVDITIRPARDEHLHHAFDTGKRIADFVCDHGCHLTHLRQGGLLDQCVLSGLASGDVGADRDVLIGFSAVVEEGYDRRVHPIEVTVLRAVSKLTVPHASIGDRVPQMFHELL